MNKIRRPLLLFLALLLVAALLAGCTSGAGKKAEAPGTVGSLLLEERDERAIIQGESYSDKESVAAYLRAYGELPPNYITKKEAQALGWISSKGNLWDVAPGKSIGGDVFGNREKLLPVKKGRTWYECDIDFDGAFRNGKRIVFSSDGLIYYSDDHYASFTEMKQ